MDKYHQDLGNDFDHYPGMHRASCQRQAEAGYDASYSDRNQRTIVTEITFESTGATYGGSVLPETSDRAYQSSSRHHGEYRRPAPRDKTIHAAQVSICVVRARIHDHAHQVRLIIHPSPHTNAHRHATGRPEPAAHERSPDFYALFDLSPSASQTEIERAVRKKRIEVHPNRLRRPGMSSDDQAWIDGQARFVGDAAEVLVDVGKRREYDESRAARQEGARVRMRRC
ncbi:hypothetical protein Q9189_006462 [Teloschistes chrysophthalmus]